MVNKKNIIIALLIILQISPLFAFDEQNRAPRDNEVVLVCRVVMTPEPDEDFFHQYIFIFDDKKPNAWTKLFPNAIQIVGSDDLKLFLGDANLMISACVKRPNNGEFSLSHFMYNFVSSGAMHVILPIMADITIPPDTQYVYLGTFLYECEGFSYDFVSMDYIDEFDEARDFVEEKYGAGDQLRRVPLRPWDMDN